MTQLFIMKHQSALGRATVKPGVMVLGRHPSCDLQINDPTVSGRHAQIATYFGLSYIQDLESKNGTYVNGRPVHMHVLRDGDVIRLGTHYIRVETRERQQRSNAAA